MKYIDLTHIITNNMPVYPGDPLVQLQATTTYQKDGVANHLLCCGMHTGTHIDAPGHLSSRDKKITDFPVSKFIGKAILINARNMQEIGINTVYNKVKKDEIILFYTGFDKNFYDPSYFHNYPVISKECAKYLADIKVKMVGVDLPTIDNAPHEIHNILLTQDILIIENLTNLQALIKHSSIEIIAMPLKVDAHAAPARVIAVIK